MISQGQPGCPMKTLQYLANALPKLEIRANSLKFFIMNLRNNYFYNTQTEVCQYAAGKSDLKGTNNSRRLPCIDDFGTAWHTGKY